MGGDKCHGVWIKSEVLQLLEDSSIVQNSKHACYRTFMLIYAFIDVSLQ